MNPKTIFLYVGITIGLVIFAMINQTLLGIFIAVAWLVTTFWEISHDWSLGLIELTGTTLLGLALGNAVGVTGFVISMGVSIYGGLVVNWFIMKHFPWLSSKWRMERRLRKRQEKEARKKEAQHALQH